MNKKLFQIKEGALVGVDHRVWAWPDVPNANLNMSFEVEPIGNGKVKCFREGFGILGSTKGYGNGAIYANDSDLVEINQEDTSFLYSVENLAVAAERYIKAVNNYHAAVESQSDDNIVNAEEEMTETYMALKSAIYNLRKKQGNRTATSRSFDTITDTIEVNFRND
jgi:hypothetical protein